MVEVKKSFNEKWIVSLMKFEDEEGIKYKVTRRVLELSVSETKMFKTKQEALKKFNEWLED